MPEIASFNSPVTSSSGEKVMWAVADDDTTLITVFVGVVGPLEEAYQRRLSSLKLQSDISVCSDNVDTTATPSSSPVGISSSSIPANFNSETPNFSTMISGEPMSLPIKSHCHWRMNIPSFDDDSDDDDDVEENGAGLYYEVDFTDLTCITQTSQSGICRRLFRFVVTSAKPMVSTIPPPPVVVLPKLITAPLTDKIWYVSRTPGVKHEVADQSNSWAFDEKANREVEAAFLAYQSAPAKTVTSTFDYAAGPPHDRQGYKIDFSTMIQTNLYHKTMRYVTRQDQASSSSSAVEIFDATFKVGDEDESTEVAANTASTASTGSNCAVA